MTKNNSEADNLTEKVESIFKALSHSNPEKIRKEVPLDLQDGDPLIGLIKNALVQEHKKQKIGALLKTMKRHQIDQSETSSRYLLEWAQKYMTR